ncbi:MAG: hypothetical protein PVH59_06170 [Anaerolineae bacterium]
MGSGTVDAFAGKEPVSVANGRNGILVGAGLADEAVLPAGVGNALEVAGLLCATRVCRRDLDGLVHGQLWLDHVAARVAVGAGAAEPV